MTLCAGNVAVIYSSLLHISHCADIMNLYDPLVSVGNQSLICEKMLTCHFELDQTTGQSSSM